MDEPSGGRKTKDRSPAFPFITIAQALERARQFYAEEKRSIAPYTRAVMHWHYSELSSGGLQTVAALKSYGLMVEPTGASGKSRQLQLSELALRILLDQRPDSNEREEYIRQAALSPAVAAEIYAKWPDGLPSDSTINHFLVLEKKFNEATALKVVKIIKENHIFAGVGRNNISSSETEIDIDETTNRNSQISIERSGDTALSEATVVVPAIATKAKAHMEQLLHLDGKLSITIHFSDTPSPDVYEWISAFASFKAKQLRETASRKHGELDAPQD